VSAFRSECLPECREAFQDTKKLHKSVDLLSKALDKGTLPAEDGIQLPHGGGDSSVMPQPKMGYRIKGTERQ
jgi:hypothetical protein